MKFRSCDFAPSHDCSPCLENPCQDRSLRHKEARTRCLFHKMNPVVWRRTEKGFGNLNANSLGMYAMGNDVSCIAPFSWESLRKKSGFLAVYHMWEISSEYNRALLVFCVSAFVVFNKCLSGIYKSHNSCGIL